MPHPCNYVSAIPYHRAVAILADPAPAHRAARRAPTDPFLARLAGDPRLVHVEHLPARPARFGHLDDPLPAGSWRRLGVERLWSHQAEAIGAVRRGESVAIATGTASGKSLCYQAPIAEAVGEGLRPATALAVFPTKALAQDQLRALAAMEVPRLVAATYDGDCTTDERTWVRNHANVVLTNPEMLHVGVLPHHERWATFLLRLRYVVIDELHTLRGIFGTHVAHLLRRLRRLCAALRLRPHLRLLERDHRRPRPARHRPVRQAGEGDHRRRLPVRSPHLRAVEPRLRRP